MQIKTLIKYMLRQPQEQKLQLAGMLLLDFFRQDGDELNEVVLGAEEVVIDTPTARITMDVKIELKI